MNMLRLLLLLLAALALAACANPDPLLTAAALSLTACGAGEGQCDAVLLQPAYFHDGYDGTGWTFTARPAGTRVVLLTGQQARHEGALWVRARLAEGESAAWIRAWEGGWLVDLDGYGG